MDPISFEQMASLALPDLVERMDLALRTLRAERDPYFDLTFDLSPYVGTYFNTSKFQGLAPENRTKAVWIIFDIIVQMEYVNSFGGIQNSLRLPQRAGDTWDSAHHLVVYMGQAQAAIVSSRIVLEKFMVLVYFLETQKSLDGKSKFKAFSKWLLALPIDSSWFYLIPQLPWLRKHDIRFRTPEVHKGSRLKKHLITLQEIPNEDQNEALDLTNLMSAILRNIIPILNGERPNSIGNLRPYHNHDWFNHYVNADLEDLKQVRAQAINDLSEA